MKDYPINVFWSDEDASWIAVIADLPGCSATGATAEKAVREVQIAKELWLEAAHEHGRQIPPPSYRPVIAQA